MFNLLEYETRRTLYNYDFSSNDPLASNVLVDNGYRIYSATTAITRNINNKVFKHEPSLLCGVVSFIAPINLYGPSAYILQGNDINTVNTVKLLNGKSASRVLFDCVELSGKPIKVYKSYVVVRGMFFNSEQVEYFRNVKLESKNGISGHIIRPLGTKGLFKAYFSQHVKHGDSIKMYLYKRIFL